jgi:xanthine/CO dehydrogenase XdhC/CoxF family maturation factor
MNDVVEKVLTSADGAVASEAREKVINYIGLLASTGKSKRQLERFGKAYLKEILEPDPRYSGC